jgi:predicted RNase H-like HicB family nuclease
MYTNRDAKYTDPVGLLKIIILAGLFTGKVLFYIQSSSMIRTFTALIQREEDMYVALCTELDIASQGANVQEARENLKEAIELFLECADPEEVRLR